MDFFYLNSSKKLPYINRELSWLKFNERILEEAENEKTPLLERLRFLCIFMDNLNEFFMIRVGSLVEKSKQGHVCCVRSYPFEILHLLKKIRQEVFLLQERHENLLRSLIKNRLSKNKIFIKTYKSLSLDQQKEIKEYYFESIFPTLTPVVVGASHSFPFLNNLVNYLFVEFEETGESKTDSAIGFVQVPSLLDSLIEVSEEKNKGRSFILLEKIVIEFVGEIFGGRKIKSLALVKVTRNLDYHLLKSNINNLKDSVAKKIITRENQRIIRLECSKRASPFLVSLIKKKLNLKDSQIYFSRYFYACEGFKKIVDLPCPELKFPLFNPRIPSRLVLSDDIFSCIREEDLLVHHPYESFYTIGEFIQTAAKDPQTVAIKQTLYRSSGDSPIVHSLMEAVRNGKDVTIIIELMARFDERNNIDWAQKLERAGVKVSYGFVGLKTHCKISIVLRKEQGKIVTYSHLSTGNYNNATANLYTDLGLLTKNEKIGSELVRLFNMITSLSFHSIRKNPFEYLIIAPHDMRKKLIGFIREVRNSSSQDSTRFIIIKINALVDPLVIGELYAASNKGVKIHLIVRGACSLRPGLASYSENIIVTSVIDRFLEHSRIFYFKSKSNERLFLGSADIMPRNFDSRVEVLFPILQENVRSRVINEILSTYCKDNVKARFLLANGKYDFIKTKKEKVRAQSKLIELARSDGFKSLPYKKAIHYDLSKDGSRPIVYE